VKAASVTCDLPAGRKVCGFLSHSATLGCSKCLKEFPGAVGNKDYSGFDTTTNGQNEQMKATGILFPKLKNAKLKPNRKKKKPSMVAGTRACLNFHTLMHPECYA